MTITLFPPTPLTAPVLPEFAQDNMNSMIVAVGTQAASAASVTALAAAPLGSATVANAGTSAGSAGDASHCAAPKVITVVIGGVTYYLAAFTANT